MHAGSQGKINGLNDQQYDRPEQCVKQKVNFNILSINVCGPLSRKKYPEFIELISKYDIIGFQETKLEKADESQFLQNYKIFFKSRRNFPK